MISHWSEEFPETKEITLIYDEKGSYITYEIGHDKSKGKLAYLYCPVPLVCSEIEIRSITEFMRNGRQRG